MRWTTILLGVTLGLVVAVSSARAADPNEGVNWIVTAYGSDDLLGIRAGLRPWEGRTELGLFGVWIDGLQEGDQKTDSKTQREAFGLGIYGLYDVVQDAEFTILSFQVPVNFYVGGEMGVLERQDSEEDATAALMTGLSFGDSSVRIGVEYQYILDDSLWREFGAMDDNHRILLTLGLRF
jgi:hypothetical protein